MFDPDFYPTPAEVIQIMLNGYDLQGKTILEPSAGKGNIVDFCISSGAEVIACEKHPDLRQILSNKCRIISEDFLTVKAEDISHIDMIIMNPPFSKDEHHILHAFNIAPDGCEIIALCNYNTLQNAYTENRKQLLKIVEQNGNYKKLGEVFTTAERKTYTNIGLIRMKKPGEKNQSEFDGFFMDEEIEQQGYGIMPYNFVRDLVNRYIGAVKIFDEQLETATRMNNTLKGFYKSKLSMTITEDDKPKTKNEFKKDLQKEAWKFIFDKMNMNKYSTQGLRSDINKFVEQQTEVPFTMRNIYKMIEIVIATHSQRMDKAIIEVFDKLTQHHDENRYNVPGWKTNSHYLMGEKFIMPYMAEPSFKSGVNIRYGNYRELIEDLIKALCYITGENYDVMANPISGHHNIPTNVWQDWGFFEFKAFKKGTIHFKFKNKDVWATLNQHVSRIKGYPLFEAKPQHKSKSEDNE